jgi:putative transposase
MDWPRLLAYITGTVDQELLLRNEYLVAENRILKTQIKGRLLLSDSERVTLAEIGHRLGRQALEEVAAHGQTQYDSGLVPKTHCQ